MRDINRAINALFIDCADKNLFTTPETQRAQHVFDTCCEALDRETAGKVEEAQMELSGAEVEAAFRVGFKTALSLVLEGLLG